MRNIVGQARTGVSFRELIDSGKILIANIPKGAVGEENQILLGSLLITKLELAATERVDVPEEERRDFHLYCDEFQNFATPWWTTSELRSKIVRPGEEISEHPAPQVT